MTARAPWLPLLVVLALAACAPGAAAAQSALRAGVPAEGLLPRPFVRVDVAVPAGRDAVTLFFAERLQAAPTVSVTVFVGDAAGDAVAWLAHERDTVSGDLPRVADLGDEAFGGPDYLLFRRANVGVLLRGIDGRDVRTLAAQVDGHVRGAPGGPPGGVPVPAWRIDAGEVERNGGLIQLPEPLLAGRVAVDGPGYVRRTRDGWRLVRTGPGDLRVRTVRVDPWLRIATDPAGR